MSERLPTYKRVIDTFDDRQEAIDCVNSWWRLGNKLYRETRNSVTEGVDARKVDLVEVARGSWEYPPIHTVHRFAVVERP